MGCMHVSTLCPSVSNPEITALLSDLETNNILFCSTIASTSKKRVGTPTIYEKFQGLSTGVLLLKLKSMRGSGASKKIDHSKKVFAEDQYNANNTISR